ncbi:hypothetical protein ABZT47_28780 [Sphaerisporangium sp. NPDC005289]|uniref:hypothetical protein n=1 Tax=Sphaerisporangium sp. NPDC005289 TaxID=3155247 RepID=UPI0033A0A3E5
MNGDAVEQETKAPIACFGAPVNVDHDRVAVFPGLRAQGGGPAGVEEDDDVTCVDIDDQYAIAALQVLYRHLSGTGLSP